MAATACAPPTAKMRSTPHRSAAKSTSGAIFPPRPAGVQSMTSPHPAIAGGEGEHQHRREERGIAARDVEPHAADGYGTLHAPHAGHRLRCRPAAGSCALWKASILDLAIASAVFSPLRARLLAASVRCLRETSNRLGDVSLRCGPARSRSALSPPVRTSCRGWRRPVPSISPSCRGCSGP